MRAIDVGIEAILRLAAGWASTMVRHQMEGRAAFADGKNKKHMAMDLDRICGVPLDTGSGGRCMRTIDCKAHTQQVRLALLPSLPLPSH